MSISFVLDCCAYPIGTDWPLTVNNRRTCLTIPTICISRRRTAMEAQPVLLSLTSLQLDNVLELKLPYSTSGNSFLLCRRHQEPVRQRRHHRQTSVGFLSRLWPSPNWLVGDQPAPIEKSNVRRPLLLCPLPKCDCDVSFSCVFCFFFLNFKTKKK